MIGNGETNGKGKIEHGMQSGNIRVFRVECPRVLLAGA